MIMACTKLGPYEILVPVGAGGIGELYLARYMRAPTRFAGLAMDVPRKAKSMLMRRTLDNSSDQNVSRNTYIHGNVSELSVDAVRLLMFAICRAASF